MSTQDDLDSDEVEEWWVVAKLCTYNLTTALALPASAQGEADVSAPATYAATTDALLTSSTTPISILSCYVHDRRLSTDQLCVFC
jgi:hypothetical protein